MKNLDAYYTLKALLLLPLCILFMLSAVTPVLASKIEKKAADILTSHQWTLVEIQQTKDDTTSNMTLFLMPCEKDNFIDYHTGGTYKIFEGEKKCKPSDNDIKGEGTWTFYEQDGVILDSYSGGREVEKEVLYIDDNRLVMEFDAEGGWTSKLTYFSELGLKDDALSEEVEDNSNQSFNISKAIRQNLIGAGRYVLIGRKDFEKGKKLDIDDKGGLFRSVIVYPLIDATDINETVNETERNEGLMEHATKVGVQYIVTGKIIQTEAKKDASGHYLGAIQYSVNILDTETGNVVAKKIFAVDKKEEMEKKEKGRKWLNRGVSALALGAGAATFSRTRGFWGNYYGYYFAEHSARNTKRTMDIVFANSVDNDERESYYQSSIAVMEAIYETEADLETFVEENIPIVIVINEIEEKKGKAKSLRIEAGGNINLQENEKLTVEKFEMIEMSNGSKVKDRELLVDIKVESIDNNYLSTCKVIKGAKEIYDEWQSNPEKVKVFTTGNISEGVFDAIGIGGN